MRKRRLQKLKQKEKTKKVEAFRKILTRYFPFDFVVWHILHLMRAIISMDAQKKTIADSRSFFKLHISTVYHLYFVLYGEYRTFHFGFIAKWIFSNVWSISIEPCALFSFGRMNSNWCTFWGIVFVFLAFLTFRQPIINTVEKHNFKFYILNIRYLYFEWDTHTHTPVIHLRRCNIKILVSKCIFAFQQNVFCE